MEDLRILINDLILDDCILRDRDFGADDGVLDHSARLDRNAAADDAVLDCSGNDGAVGDQGLLDGSALDILCRACVICSCVDRPFCREEAGSCLIICEFKVCIVIGLEVSDGFEVALVLYSLDVELFCSSLVIYDVEQIVHGGFLFCLVDKVDEEIIITAEDGVIPTAWDYILSAEEITEAKAASKYATATWISLGTSLKATLTPTEEGYYIIRLTTGSGTAYKVIKVIN